MATRKIVKASPEPSLPAGPPSHAGVDDIKLPASNATRQLEKPRVRSKAHADQATLQDEGPNALPVSDYPLKKGPLAANSIDLQEQASSRARLKQG